MKRCWRLFVLAVVVARAVVDVWRRRIIKSIADEIEFFVSNDTTFKDLTDARQTKNGNPRTPGL